MRPYPLLYILLLCLPCVAFSQSIVVRNVNVSAYPVISAEIFVLDHQGVPVHTLVSSDLELTVNWNPTQVQTLSCPPPRPPLPMWAVVACDRSLSMRDQITDRVQCIDVATAGIRTFIETVDFSAGDTRVALMTFDTAATVLMHFVHEKVSVLSRVGGIRPIDAVGTNYNRAFLDRDHGALTLLKQVPFGHERALILLSDGTPTAGDFDFTNILQEVLDNNITVYPLIIKEPASYQLEQLAFRTGGVVYGGIVDVEKIREIYHQIAKRTQLSKDPCRITWTVDRCDTTRRHTARLRYSALGAETMFTYDIGGFLKPAKVAAGRDETICNGSSITLRATGNSTTGSYQWSGEWIESSSSATPTVSPKSTTTYTVVFTDNHGCTATDELTVNVISSHVDIPVDSVFICRGESTTLSATGNGKSYSWSPAAGIEGTSTSAVIVVRPATTTTYYVTSMLNSCTARDSVVVAVVDLENALDLGSDVAVCTDSSIVLVPVGIEGRYQWFPAAGLDRTDIRTPTARPAQTTTYYLTVTTASGCTTSDSITVTVHPRPVVDAGADVAICTGQFTTLAAQAQEGTFRWSPAAGLERTDSGTVRASPLSTTVYTVLYIDLNECTATDEVTVRVSESLAVDAGDEQSICPGESVQLTIEGGDGTVVWSPVDGLDDPTSATPTASPMQTTVYTAVVTSPAGCIGIDSVRVVVHPGATVDAGRDILICKGQSTLLSPSGSEGTYEWSPVAGLDNPALPNPTASPDATTMYTVVVTDINGCRATDSVLVTVRPYANVRFSLMRRGNGVLDAGQDEELVLQVEGVDPTRDTLTAFECIFAYDMESLQYQPGTVLVGNAASNWTISADEQADKGILVLQGNGPLLVNGTFCTFTMRPYLSMLGARTGKMEIKEDGVFVETESCVFPSSTGLTLPVTQPCIYMSRAVRYTGNGYSLKQNTPNPAQMHTTVEFSIGLDGPTSLVLYNALGEQVLLLADKILAAGSYSVELPINELPSGLYYYRLISGPYTHTRQMLIRK